MQRQRLVEVAIFEHVEDRREGLLDHRADLGRHLDQSRAGVERVGAVDIDALAAMDDPARGLGLGERLLHRRECAAVDQRADQRRRSGGVADRNVAIDLRQLGRQGVIDALVHDEAGGPHRAEGDGAQRQVEIG